jgi:hypothetical protein
MSSLIGKRIGGQTYYYLREVARVGGRPPICAPLPVSWLAVRAAPNSNCAAPASRSGCTRPLV